LFGFAVRKLFEMELFRETIRNILSEYSGSLYKRLGGQEN
jgi:hypothetical protein